MPTRVLVSVFVSGRPVFLDPASPQARVASPTWAAGDRREDFGPSLLQTRAQVLPWRREEPALRLRAVEAENCAQDFKLCWDPATNLWGGDAACRASFITCRRTLCKDWLRGSCQKGSDSCKTVAHMCRATEARDASGNVMDVRHPLVFLHLPKNAGTAVEEAGHDGHVNWGRYRTWGAVQMPDGYWCNKYHVPPVLLPDPEIYLNSEVFCVVRNPFDRAVSEYKYLLSMPWGDTYFQMPKEEDKCHPSGLNKYLAEVMNAVMAGYTYINDCHMIKQSTYIWSHGKQWCQDIIPIESLAEEFPKIMKRVGYKVALKEEANAATMCENLTAEDLDETTRQMLRTYYADDFLNLNYSLSP